jgi:hypothetical protein
MRDLRNLGVKARRFSVPHNANTVQILIIRMLAHLFRTHPARRQAVSH